MRYLITLLVLSLLFAACESVPAGPDPEQDPIGYGQYMYERKCQQCHELYDPAEYTRKALDRSLRRYAPQAGLKREDRPYVLEYLLANAKDAR